MMKNDADVSIEIGQPKDVEGLKQKQADESECSAKTLRERLAYFSGKAADSHGIRLNLKGRNGSKSVWLNPFNLLKDENLMETDEINRAVQALGIESIDKLKVKRIECPALGFRQSFTLPKELDHKTIEEISTISAMLIELETNGCTQEFKNTIETENAKELSDVIALYEKFTQTHTQSLDDCETQFDGITMTMG